MRNREMGQLESEVLTVLWETGGWVSPREVGEALPSRPRVAYNTIGTVLVRLCRKGLVERRREGRRFVYRAVQSREEVEARRMAEVLEASGDRRAALATFVERLDTRDRAALRRLLEGERR